MTESGGGTRIWLTRRKNRKHYTLHEKMNWGTMFSADYDLVLKGPYNTIRAAQDAVKGSKVVLAERDMLDALGSENEPEA